MLTFVYQHCKEIKFILLFQIILNKNADINNNIGINTL